MLEALVVEGGDHLAGLRDGRQGWEDLAEVNAMLALQRAGRRDEVPLG